MKALDWLLLALVALAVAAALRSIIRRRQRGCHGCCSSYHHCPYQR